jgi:hypothetical protein
MTDDEPQHDEPAAERAAKGVIMGWIVAKTMPWIVRLAVWAAWLAALGGYVGYVWWRVRRTIRAEGSPNIGAWLHRTDAPQ